MKDADERIAFLLKLSALDLRHMRAGDWLNLRDDLADFLGIGPRSHEGLYMGGRQIASPTTPPFPKDMTEDALRALQAELIALLGALVGGRDTTQSVFPTFEIGATRYALVGSPNTGPLVSVTGATRDIVLLTAIQLLVREDTAKVARCPECGRIFHRIRRQRYCERACVNKANKREWRAGRSKPRKAKSSRRRVAPRPPAAITDSPRAARGRPAVKGVGTKGPKLGVATQGER
jgi:uncharacterized C2H2 Zn-finger protein